MSISELTEKLLSGDPRSIARAITKIESGSDDAAELMKAVFPHTGKAMVIGITGSPGAGKSSLVDKLALFYKDKGELIGIVCVDPSSPFSGGAILGDRIRMATLGLDKNVFIRSMATRGKLGGLSRSTVDAVAILDAAGFDKVIVETVGVGQDEVDVMRAAHTTVVVSVPGLGDEIQAIKSGLLEIADVLVVNKADRPGVDQTERDLVHMQGLRAEPREVEIVRTIATHGHGVAELAGAIERHRARTWTGEAAVPRTRARAAAHLTELVRGLLAERAAAALEARGGIDALAAERTLDPWTLAAQIVDGQV